MSSRLGSVYGLTCELDFEWPWCPSVERPAGPRIRLHLGDLGPYERGQEDAHEYAVRTAGTPDAVPVLRIERATGRHFRITYRDGSELVIGPELDEVFGVSRSALILDDLLVYLQGPVLGFLLRLRGVTCLHASAALSGGQAFGVIGAAGMGKSGLRSRASLRCCGRSTCSVSACLRRRPRGFRR